MRMTEPQDRKHLFSSEHGTPYQPWVASLRIFLSQVVILGRVLHGPETWDEGHLDRDNQSFRDPKHHPEMGWTPGGHVPLTRRKTLLEKVQSRPSKENLPGKTLVHVSKGVCAKSPHKVVIRNT